MLGTTFKHNKLILTVVLLSLLAVLSFFITSNVVKKNNSQTGSYRPLTDTVIIVKSNKTTETSEQFFNDQFKFSIRYPKLWVVERILLAEATKTQTNNVIYRLTAPGTQTKVSDDDHENTKEVKKGALVYLTVTTNKQYTTLNLYKKALSNGYLKTSKNIRMAGIPAIEYTLNDNLEYEGQPRLYTTFFKDNIQYTLSYVSNDANLQSSKYYVDYRTILKNFELTN